MKISIFLESFQPEYWGGRETRWHHLIDGLSPHAELTVFADFSRCPKEIAFPNPRLNFVDIGPLPAMYNASGTRSIKHALIFTLRSFKLLSKNVDVILTDQTPLISLPVIRLISLVSRSKLSVTWHEVWGFQTWLKYSKVSGLIGVFVQTIGILASKNIVVPSPRVRKDLESKTISKSSTVIPNGMNQHNLSLRPKMRFHSDGPVKLLYVGRLIKHKNCDFLIEVMNNAVQRGRNWKLTVIGQGPMQNQLHELAQGYSLSGQIEFKSNLSQEELSLEYSSSDLFIFPSQREGFGISVAEAISHGLPVIVYDVPENASVALVENKSYGSILSNLDPSVWVAEIVEILHRKNARSNVGERSFLDWGIVSKIYMEFLNGIAEDDRDRRSEK